MSTVKITELPAISVVNANTANTVLVGVDIQTDVTGKITLTTLAAGLYSNNILRVGNNDVLLTNAAAQFTGNANNYLQVTLRNQTANGSGDYVVTADDGSDSDHYIDLGINGSTFSDPTYSATKEHDGYLYLQSSGTSKGNLVIGTTNAQGEVRFVVGGIETDNVVGKITTLGLYSKGIDSVVSANATSANSVINTRISANVATLRGEITNNAASTNAFANLAFTKANTALQNTTGTFAGDLTFTGNVSSNYAMRIQNSTMPGNGVFLLITGSANDAYGIPSNPGYTIQTVSPDGQGNRIVAEAYGSLSNGYASFIGRRARGTASSPSAIQANDIIVRLGGNGYGSTKFSQFSDARIEFVATENHTDTSKGTQIQFWTTAVGSNSASQIGTMNGNTVTFTGTVEPQKGFIYTPNVQSTLTSYNLDFSKESLVKFNITDNMTITLSNYQFGKVVEVWITNSAAQNKVITHGCLSNNSTSKATSFTILAQSCAYLRYFSIDGDQANTFVSITA